MIKNLPALSGTRAERRVKMYSKKQLKAVQATVRCAADVLETICSVGVLRFDENEIAKMHYDLTVMSCNLTKMINEEDRPDV